MPSVGFIPAVEFVWTPRPATPPAEVRAPALPRKRSPRSPAKKKPARKPKLTPQLRTVLIDNLEAALEDGRIDLHDDFEDCEFLDLTHGELVLLGAILYPDELERAEFVAELVKRLEKRRRGAAAAKGAG